MPSSSGWPLNITLPLTLQFGLVEQPGVNASAMQMQRARSWNSEDIGAQLTAAEETRHKLQADSDALHCFAAVGRTKCMPRNLGDCILNELYA